MSLCALSYCSLFFVHQAYAVGLKFVANLRKIFDMVLHKVLLTLKSCVCCYIHKNIKNSKRTPIAWNPFVYTCVMSYFLLSFIFVYSSFRPLTISSVMSIPSLPYSMGLFVNEREKMMSNCWLAALYSRIKL